MAAGLRSHVSVWWDAMLHVERAGQLALDGVERPGFGRFLWTMIAVLYGVYGLSMGLFRGSWPGIVSALKLPFLYLATLAICLPAFYTLSCVAGPRFKIGQSVRVLMLAVSANAVALCSYAPISFFFTLTTSREGYRFLALMHVAVFAVSGVISVTAILLIFRAAAARLGMRIGTAVGLTWGVLYAFVGSEVAWVLRPWIGWWEVEYTPFRALEKSFVEAVWFMLTR